MVVALVVVFGLVGVSRLPIQLLPDIEQPQVSIGNFWRAAAPEEMEAEIVEPIEQVLRNIPGLTEISSWITRGAGWVNLTFEPGTDIQEAKLDVINNLGQAAAATGGRGRAAGAQRRRRIRSRGCIHAGARTAG